jgi:hypothetical protein
VAHEDGQARRWRRRDTVGLAAPDDGRQRRRAGETGDLALKLRERACVWCRARQFTLRPTHSNKTTVRGAPWELRTTASSYAKSRRTPLTDRLSDDMSRGQKSATPHGAKQT